MNIKKGDIKELENKYGVAWSIFSDYGNYDPHNGSQAMINDPKLHYQKMDEEWVVDNSSCEPDGNYLLHSDGIFSETELIIKNGKIDIESALKACDEILKKENSTTLHYIESFEKKSINEKEFIEVFMGT